MLFPGILCRRSFIQKIYSTTCLFWVFTCQHGRTNLMSVSFCFRVSARRRRTARGRVFLRATRPRPPSGPSFWLSICRSVFWHRLELLNEYYSKPSTAPNCGLTILKNSFFLVPGPLVQIWSVPAAAHHPVVPGLCGRLDLNDKVSVKNYRKLSCHEDKFGFIQSTVWYEAKESS